MKREPLGFPLKLGDRRLFERSAPSDVWRNTLSLIPSVFGRLVYLSSLRDTNSGRYQHLGLAQRYGEVATHEALRDSHRRSFQEWIAYSIESKQADLNLYLTDLQERKRTIVASWLHMRPYQSVVPSPVSPMELKLYLSDFEVLLELLKNEYGVVLEDPDA